MTVYIVLLRGINVGGKNMIRMADLKRSLTDNGLKEVQTYIQSGNVLFVSDEEEEALRVRIEQIIRQDFGLDVPVVLRTSAELRGAAAGCPFTAEEISAAEAASAGECLYAVFLQGEPSAEALERFAVYANDKEQFRAAGREVYLLFSDSVRNSKLAANLQKLDESATVRNWKTVNKLVSLAEGLEKQQ
ncbi:DUF1697 domain-containing protein [Paenibacillus macerans]|uniref:DUF1697 domain-containing protein n=1 Tax=Paenibacillus macerans TaxID=44252 RepID=A0A6N8F0Z0_PAEMA|nr:DUF1697 domain-containing protein [Paenibacillus macerans]MUG24318.1 DUF1697 domain-containing protein [Paenibacillus macerans]UMV50328.1 DUF1697 domain-containing protein [Paenibacillus macerans]